MKNKRILVASMMLVIVGLVSISCNQGIAKSVQQEQANANARAYYNTVIQDIIGGNYFVSGEYDVSEWKYSSKAVSIEEIKVNLHYYNSQIESTCEDYPDNVIRKKIVFLGNKSEGIKKDAYAEAKYYSRHNYGDKNDECYVEIKFPLEQPASTAEYRDELMKVWKYMEKLKWSYIYRDIRYKAFADIAKDSSVNIAESSPAYKHANELYKKYIAGLDKYKAEIYKAKLKQDKLNDKAYNDLYAEISKLFALEEIKLTKEEKKAKKALAKEQEKKLKAKK